MKNVLTSFLLLISFQTFAFQWQTISGNGNLKKESREALGYTGVASNGSMNVIVSYGNSNNITLEADENILPYIETSIDKGILVIKAKKGINLKSKNKIQVNVSLTKLTSLRLSGSGNISGDGAFNNNDKTDISISGSGNIDLGFGSLNDVAISISGSGNVDLKGKSCNNITASISGSGNIDCSGVASNNVFAKVSGSGNVRVFANNSIDAQVSGSGNVYYKGTASRLNSKTSGSGKIIKI